MTPGRARLVGLSILVVCVVSVAASVPLEVANSRVEGAGVVIVGDPDAARVQGLVDEIGDREFSGGGPEPGIAVVLALSLIWIVVGTLILSRQPRNWAGWTFIAVAAPFPLAIICTAVVRYGAHTEPGPVPLLSLWAVLADQGLAAALEAQARKAAVPVQVRAENVGRYAADVESAVYFSCLEALNNIAKYASADSAEISLSQTNGSLDFEIRDDGRGFDQTGTGYGTGLQGIIDRLDAIGGSVTIETEPGAGTSVSCRVPLGGAS